MFRNADSTPDSSNRPKIAVDDNGSTTIDGALILQQITVSNDRQTDSMYFQNRKAIRLDTDSNTLAGGAMGSRYTFYYMRENKIYADCHGLTSSGSNLSINHSNTTNGAFPNVGF